MMPRTYVTTHLSYTCQLYLFFCAFFSTRQTHLEDKSRRMDMNMKSENKSLDKTGRSSTNNVNRENDCEAVDLRHALFNLHFEEEDEIDRSEAACARSTCNALIDLDRITLSTAASASASASASEHLIHLSSTCSAAVHLQPMRCSRPRTCFPKKSLLKKMRSPVKPFEGDGVHFDEFQVPSVADRRLRHAFRLEACASEGYSSADRQTKTRRLLSSDIACPGMVVEKVIEVARPRAVYNRRLGCQMHLEMSARVYWQEGSQGHP